MITPRAATMNARLIADAVKAATRIEQRAIQAETARTNIQSSVHTFVIRCEEDSRRLQSYRNQAAERGISAELNTAIAAAKAAARAAARSAAR